jgi:hypothetical protein
MAHDANYSLICPFLTDEFEFARGVEFGMFYARLRLRPREIREYVLLPNQDQILLLASRFGYRVVKMKPWGEQWLFIWLRRGRRPRKTAPA